MAGSPDTLFVFAQLHVCAFVNGEQVVELQDESLLSLWADKAEARGYDPTQFIIETTHCAGKMRLRKDTDPDSPWKWRVEPA